MFSQLPKLPKQIWTFARLAPASWLDDGLVAACRYPRSERELQHLANAGVTLIVNLHQREHSSEQLAMLGLAQLHLPVKDFMPPTQEQLALGVATMREVVASGG